MSSNNKWMPLFVGDYLRDTSHLSTSEHGCYLLLLMHAWGHDGVLPAEEERLRRIGKMDTKAWAAARGTILEFFYRAEDGYRQKRVDQELTRAQAVCEKRQDDRDNATARMRKWRANRNEDPPPKPNGDGSVTRHESVTSQSPRPSRDGAGDGYVTRASQLQPQVQVHPEEGNKVSYLIPLTGDSESRAKENEPDAVGSEAVAAQVRRVARACAMNVHYPTSHTRSEQLEALEAVPQPEDALEGEVIPPGFRCQPHEPIRTVAEQLAILRGAA
jgi:uncharacterized protein YdaU (DUF1376 family)